MEALLRKIRPAPAGARARAGFPRPRSPQRHKILGNVLALLLCVLPPGAHARETVNDITQLNPIVVSAVEVPTSIAEVSRLVASHRGPVSIGGGRFSQGGQTACTDCLFLDMRGLNRILEIDAPQRFVRVEAGATWRQIQEAIDPLNLSLKIMQSYSNFTVGGSISVNAHGNYVGQGALVNAVRSIKVVLADGSIKTASRTQNSDLFFGVVGGYGGLGVIVEATLDLVDNTALERVAQHMPVSAYRAFFYESVAGSKAAVLHWGVLYPPHYRHVTAITAYETTKPVTVDTRLASQDRPSWFQRRLLAFATDSSAGKWFRRHIYDHLDGRLRHAVVWRNYEASQDVNSLEPASRAKRTYVLQEYFVPTEHFDDFVPKMASILRSHRANVLNIAIRHAKADPDTLLSWAPREVFSFVLYYAQGVEPEDKDKVTAWTRELIELVIEEGGDYYLPYQIIATKEQFLKAYPRAPEYFALKRKVDPTYKFHSRLWDAYYTP